MPAKARAATGDDQLRKQAMARIAKEARTEARANDAGAARPRRSSSSASSSTRTRRPRPSSAQREAAAAAELADEEPAAAAAAAPAAAPSSAAAASSSPSSPSSSSSSGPRSFGTEGAGALLALFAYPLVVNLLQGGPAQMWGWVRAKWLNQPYGGVSSAGPTSAAGRQTVFLPPATKAANGGTQRTGLKAT